MAGRRKLLVVDDQPEICEVIRSYLDQQGYGVDYATDGLSAKGRLEADAYDLVILDILMPGEGGLKLVKFAETQDIPVLLMSGHPVMIGEIAQQFPYPLLSKPFHLKELDEAVRSAIEAWHNRHPDEPPSDDDARAGPQTRAPAKV
jgi:two-component system phosphate regulon response regulator OmpR